LQFGLKLSRHQLALLVAVLQISKAASKKEAEERRSQTVVRGTRDSFEIERAGRHREIRICDRRPRSVSFWTAVPPSSQEPTNQPTNNEQDHGCMPSPSPSPATASARIFSLGTSSFAQKVLQRDLRKGWFSVLTRNRNAPVGSGPCAMEEEQAGDLRPAAASHHSSAKQQL